MKKRWMSAAVLLAVMIGTAVEPYAGISVRGGAETKQIGQNISSERMQLNTFGNSSGRVVSLSLRENHSGAVTEDGGLYVWGNNFRGKLGDGTDADSNRPVKVMDNIQTVSLGDFHSGAVTKDGSLYMWGNNDWGGLGNGTQEHRSRPEKVMDNVQMVSLGDWYSGAVTRDGGLYMWGQNNSNVSPPQGILGDGTNENRNRPVKVMDNVQTVSLGESRSGAVAKDGSLYVWGFDGIGEERHHNRPVKVMDSVQMVSMGWSHSGAVTKDGSLYMWGTNVDGELGDGTNENRNRPVKVMDNVQTVSLGTNHSGAVTKDGSLYMWGSNAHGELGDGTNENHNRPVKVMDNVQMVSLGANYSGAVTKDGSLYMWGSNDMGKLGDGTNESHNRPIKISLFSTAKASQKITYHSSAIKKGKIAYGTTFSLNAKTTGTGNLTYKSSNSSILSVDASGTVTVKGYGPAYIKIKASGGNGYKSAVRKFKLTAVPRRGKITKAEWQKSGVYFKWKPEKTADGYEYALAYNKKFSGQSRKKINKTGIHLTKYKTGTKKMFLKVRTYKKAGKKTYYGSWSSPRSVKLKKNRGGGQSSYVITD